MSAVAATTNPRAFVTYDRLTGTLVHRSNLPAVVLNGTSNVTLLGPPAANEVFEVRVVVSNIDTAAVTLILEFYDGTTATQLYRTQLAVNDTAVFE